MRHVSIRFFLRTAATLSLLGAGAANAQSLGANGIHPVVGKPKSATAPTVAPAGLPGAVPPVGGVAPAQIAPSDMQPNDALFDAINRGDIVAARDAMGRGADMNAKNILGMTPLELSVDLARNDITFYLLSLRGSDSGPKVAAQPAVKPPSTKLVAKVVRAPQVAVAQRPLPKPAPPQYASGAAADPGAGFLGFGGTQTP